MKEHLRTRAEAFLHTTAEESPALVLDEVKELVHELQIHQIELEMQNEELRQAQIDLTLSRDSFADLYDYAPIGYISIDLHGIIHEANLTATTLLKVLRTHLVGRRFSQFIHPHSQDDWFLYHRALLLATEIQVTELELRHENEPPFTARLEARPKPGVTSEDWRCMIALIDVSDRTHAEALLRASEERLRLAAEATGFGSFDYDIREHRLLGSSQFYAMAGLPETTVTNRKLFLERIHPDDREQVSCRLDQALQSSGPERHECEFRIVQPSGEIRWVQVVGRTFREGRGAAREPVRIVGTVQDITEGKQAGEALHRLNKELEQRVEDRTADLRRLTAELTLAEERERQRIAGELHDDLGQILALCQNELDRIGTKGLSEKSIESAERLRELLDQADSGTREMIFDLYSPLLHNLGLVPALEHLCADFERQHPISLLFEAEDRDMHLSEANRIALYRSVRELLMNVVKHAQATEIRCALSRSGDFVRAEVSDNGIGFDASLAGSGFSQQGGFGLFNMQVYVQHVGGRLRLKSRPGDGTRVVLEIPWKDERGHDPLRGEISL